MRRAGLARFCTFACVLGLATAGLGGSCTPLAVGGLTLALSGLVLAVARRDSRSGQGLLVLSVLLTGLFTGYLIGTLRVAEIDHTGLGPLLGKSVGVELELSGSVRERGGWQSAPAVVRSLRLAEGLGGGIADGALGETVWLEVPPQGRDSSAVFPPRLAQGMVLACEAKVQAPKRGSGSGYDQARQLLIQGIRMVMVAGDGSIEALGVRGGVSGWFDRLRDGAREHLSLGPDSRVDEVLQGVVMGDTQGIDDVWLQAFRRSGTAHMLSVSGLHVASLAVIMIGLARLLRTPRWFGFLLAALSAVFMIPFVGASPPIIRSAVMIVIVLLGRWVGRGRDQWQVLGLAAVVILALSPFALFDVGFQLSFAAFVGMMALTGPLQRPLQRLPPAVASSIAVSVAASIGTAPVALAQFGQTSLVSPLANLLVVPTLPFVTGLGMASVFLGFVWSGLSVALDHLASVPMTWTVLVSRVMGVAPVLRSADMGRVLTSLLGVVAALPLSIALLGRRARTPFDVELPFFRRTLKWLLVHRPREQSRALALSVAVMALGFTLGFSAYPAGVWGVQTLQALVGERSWPDEVEVRVLDVGQGNAVLVRTPERHALLFDGGPKDCDLGRQLRSLGVAKLDLVLVSHPHADHFAGLLQSLGGIEVGTFIDHVWVEPEAPAQQNGGGFDGRGDEEAREYLRLRNVLAAQGCRYALAGTGDRVVVDGVVVRLFAPDRPLGMVDGGHPWAARGGLAPTGDELNGASLVALVSVGSGDVLLCGDAEAEVLERYDLPEMEAIVVGHHGSRGCVSHGLLEDIGARVAVVSVGEHNPFGHPFPGTISLLEQMEAVVARTDTAGWVSLELDGGQMVITTERTPHPWATSLVSL